MLLYIPLRSDITGQVYEIIDGYIITLYPTTFRYNFIAENIEKWIEDLYIPLRSDITDICFKFS